MKRFTRGCQVMLGLAALWCSVAVARAAEPSRAETDFFEAEVRPILVSACQECHGATKQESGLRLDSRRAALVGGDSGPALVPGNAEKSLLIRAVRHAGDVQMPPDDKLEPAAIETLVKWIDQGAAWPAAEGAAEFFVRTGEITAEDRDWWSFRPVQLLPLPPIQNAAWPRNAVDHFVLAQLESAGLEPNDDASKEKLLRRVTLDLTGLLPTVEQLDAFMADDSPKAFERVVDRLLASPAYGEQWGRHWLDLVRYADSSGVTSDHPVPQAYLYRNYVIDAFNADKPYDQFLREQLAGDILAADHADDLRRYAELVTASGYVAISRRFGFEPNDDQHLTIQDTLDNVGQVMLGMSIGCARCHDHKFEPITARDYYALYGIFSSTHYPYPGAEYNPRPSGLHPLLPSQAARQRQEEYDQQLAALDRELKQLADEKKHQAANGWATEANDSRRAELEQQRVSRVERGPFPVAYSVAEGTPRNAQLQRRGEPTRLGEEVPRRFLEVLGGERLPTSDGWQTAPLAKPIRLEAGREYVVSVNVHTHYVASEESALELLPSKPLTLLRGQYGIPGQCPDQKYGKAYFVDVVFEGDAASEDSSRVRSLFTTAMPIHRGCADNVAYELGTVFKPQVSGQVTALRFYRAAGESGVNTGRIWDETGELLASADFPGVPGSGRRELADWIATPDNPLTARVMVNRIWQHHFGQGLVRSANDFGHRGELPSHPELLDYLAARFVDSGWSIKSLHRLILASRTYQLSSQANGSASRVDPENRWLWRFQRRRLPAENIRDNLLAIGGSLDRARGGPHPFPPVHTWSFTQHNPFTAQYDHQRRSVYLMTQRIKRQPFLALFDGADPNATTPIRLNTIVPAQSLYLMNAPLVHQQSESFARRLIESHTNDAARLEHAYRAAYSRFPTDSERRRASEFLQHYRKQLQTEGVPTEAQELASWAALARGLLSANEFISLE